MSAAQAWQPTQLEAKLASAAVADAPCCSWPAQRRVEHEIAQRTRAAATAPAATTAERARLAAGGRSASRACFAGRVISDRRGSLTGAENCADAPRPARCAAAINYRRRRPLGRFFRAPPRPRSPWRKDAPQTLEDYRAYYVDEAWKAEYSGYPAKARPEDLHFVNRELDGGCLASLGYERFELPKAGPLQKYDVPSPSSDAATAAVAGDLARLESCEDVATPDASGNTPLIWAADSGAADCVPYLRDRCDVNHRGYLGATAVCRAARKGHLDALQLLLKADGVDVNAPNDKMQSPLHFAAFKRNRACVEALLAVGASTYVLDRKGRTPAEDTSDEEIRAAILDGRAS